MRGGVQTAKLLAFGPIRLCTDNVVRFVQMLQCFDIFALLETLAPGQVFLLISSTFMTPRPRPLSAGEYMILALSTSTITRANSASAWALTEF